MARRGVFVRRRDGTIEVNLNEFGREFVREQFSAVAATSDDSNVWHQALHQPIDPSRDIDELAAVELRASTTLSNVELAIMTIDEQRLNDGEGWAWLSCLQLALRAAASVRGLANDNDVQALEGDDAAVVFTLQALLFDLADCLAGTQDSR